MVAVSPGNVRFRARLLADRSSPALVVEAVVADEAALGVVQHRATFRAADAAGDRVGVLAGRDTGVRVFGHLVGGD